MTALARHALGTLSYHETMAVKAVFEELPNGEGSVVTSRIAERTKLTRSIVTEAFNRLKTAGLVEARSMGQKGYFVRVINPFFLDELKRVG